MQFGKTFISFFFLRYNNNNNNNIIKMKEIGSPLFSRLELRSCYKIKMKMKTITTLACVFAFLLHLFVNCMCLQT